jgi:hypothetical protein
VRQKIGHTLQLVIQTPSHLLAAEGVLREDGV